MYSLYWKEHTTYGSMLGFNPLPPQIIIDNLPFVSPLTTFRRLSRLLDLELSSDREGEVCGECAREGAREDVDLGVCGGVLCREVCLVSPTSCAFRPEVLREADEIECLGIKEVYDFEGEICNPGFEICADCTFCVVDMLVVGLDVRVLRRAVMDKR